MYKLALWAAGVGIKLNFCGHAGALGKGLVPGQQEEGRIRREWPATKTEEGHIRREWPATKAEEGHKWQKAADRDINRMKGGNSL